MQRLRAPHPLPRRAWVSRWEQVGVPAVGVGVDGHTRATARSRWSVELKLRAATGNVNLVSAVNCPARDQALLQAHSNVTRHSLQAQAQTSLCPHNARLPESCMASKCKSAAGAFEMCSISEGVFEIEMNCLGNAVHRKGQIIQLKVRYDGVSSGVGQKQNVCRAYVRLQNSRCSSIDDCLNRQLVPSASASASDAVLNGSQDVCSPAQVCGIAKERLSVPRVEGCNAPSGCADAPGYEACPSYPLDGDWSAARLHGSDQPNASARSAHAEH